MAISALPSTIIRAKGILFIDENPARQTLFPLVGKRWDLSPGPPWGESVPKSQVTLIGLPGDVDDDSLISSFQPALVV